MRDRLPAPVAQGFSPAFAAIAAAALLVGACGGAPSISIQSVGSPKPTAIEVHGLPSSDLRALAGAGLTMDAWQDIFRVSVHSVSQNPMAGDYRIEDGRVRFTPMFGFDEGRTFVVTFAPDRIPGATAGDVWRAQRVAHVLTVPASDKPRTTTVRQVYPSGAELPENMLRFYIEFSAPMGRGEALPHVRLIDDTGKDVVDPFLPVEAEFWSPDRTRFTLFFDPGRVKRDIKPNRDMGRALIAGRRYALVIDDKWTDGAGAPLQSAHRHEFTAAAAVERPLDHRAWKIVPPSAGSRDPLTVTFPWALDHGLLQRSIQVKEQARAIQGASTIDAGEQRWTFTPAEAWARGDYALEIAPELEDPAGNRLGRAFEVTSGLQRTEGAAKVFFAVK
jgi:hypothetical protein